MCVFEEVETQSNEYDSPMYYDNKIISSNKNTPSFYNFKVILQNIRGMKDPLKLEHIID